MFTSILEKQRTFLLNFVCRYRIVEFGKEQPGRNRSVVLGRPRKLGYEPDCKSLIEAILWESHSNLLHFKITEILDLRFNSLLTGMFSFSSLSKNLSKSRA